MNNQIFRKKSLDKISSPEQLNDYIRVSNPGIWLVLASVIVLLIGVCVWSVFGRLETAVQCAAVVQDGEMTVYVKEAYLDALNQNGSVTVDGISYEILSAGQTPMQVTESLDAYIRHTGDLAVDEWIVTASASGDALPDGVYAAELLTERIAPMSFVLN